MNKGQRKADGNRRKSDRRLAMSCSHDDKEKPHRQHDFGKETRAQSIFAGRVLGISIRRKSASEVKIGRSAGDGVQHRSADDRTNHLRYHVWEDEAGREPTSAGQSHSYRRIDVAP